MQSVDNINHWTLSQIALNMSKSQTQKDERTVMKYGKKESQHER